MPIRRIIRDWWKILRLLVVKVLTKVLYYIIINIEFHMKILQGRVKFPTGGDSPRAWIFIRVDLVKLQNRQYSLDGRRI